MNTEQELFETIKSNNIQVIASILFTEKWKELRFKLKKDLGVYWVAFQHTFDFAYWSKLIDIPDLYFLYTPTWLDWMQKTQKEQPSSTNNVRCMGFWEMEQPIN